MARMKSQTELQPDILSQRAGSSPPARRRWLTREAVLLLALVVLFTAFAIKVQGFLDPYSLLDRARSTLRSWISRYAERPPGALLEWKEILSQPLDEVSTVALERSPHGDRLRKSSPLSVLVPRGERRKIYAAH